MDVVSPCFLFVDVLVRNSGDNRSAVFNHADLNGLGGGFGDTVFVGGREQQVVIGRRLGGVGRASDLPKIRTDLGSCAKCRKTRIKRKGVDAISVGVGGFDIKRDASALSDLFNFAGGSDRELGKPTRRHRDLEGSLARKVGGSVVFELKDDLEDLAFIRQRRRPAVSKGAGAWTVGDRTGIGGRAR